MSARHELLEAAGYLETHGCLPKGLATAAVREVVDPLMPGDKAEIVVALQMAAEAGTGSSAPATAPIPPEVREARVVEEVARALEDSCVNHGLCSWEYLAAAAVAAYRATQDGGAEEAVRDALLKHHPIAHTMTGPLKGCRCGQVKLGQDVIGHVATRIRAALAPQAGDGAR